MRKIERQMNQAMRYFRPFSSSNTTVVQNDRDMDVFLHGNHIASLCKISMDLRIFDGGWQSNTCLLYTSPSPRDLSTSRMPSSA